MTKRKFRVGDKVRVTGMFTSYLYVKWNSFGLRFARRHFGH